MVFAVFAVVPCPVWTVSVEAPLPNDIRAKAAPEAVISSIRSSLFVMVAVLDLNTTLILHRGRIGCAHVNTVVALAVVPPTMFNAPPLTVYDCPVPGPDPTDHPEGKTAPSKLYLLYNF
jgi:hypothetical protein